MFIIKTTKGYRKSLKKLVRSGNFDIKKLEEIINLLATPKTLLRKHKDHELSGNLSRFRECHIQPDILLEYFKDENQLILVLVNISNHANMFK